MSTERLRRAVHTLSPQVQATQLPLNQSANFKNLRHYTPNLNSDLAVTASHNPTLFSDCKTQLTATTQGVTNPNHINQRYYN